MRLKKRAWGKQALALTLAGAVAAGTPVSAFADTYYLEKGDITVYAETETDEATGETKTKQTVTQKVTVTDDDGNETEEEQTLAEDDQDITIRDFVSEDPANAEAAETAEASEETDAEEEAAEQTAQEQEQTSGNDTGNGEDEEADEPDAQSDDGQDADESATAVEKTVSHVLKIIAKAGAQAKVTLADVNIDVSDNETTRKMGKAAIEVKAAESSTVTIELDGYNTVKSGSLRAGVEKGESEEFDETTKQNKPMAESGTLVIQDTQGSPVGSLVAEGGNAGAGIGGAGWGEDDNTAGYAATQNITIDGGSNGGTIVVRGGAGAAGIGGGYDQDSYSSDAVNITIQNANVEAYGGAQAPSWTTDTNKEGKAGAGIGGGRMGDAKNIKIENSTVKAVGYGMAAGIGGGTNANAGNGSFRGGNASEITISNSVVDAAAKVSTEKNYAAAIGGGAFGTAESIIITGSEVTATAAGDGAGIGGGDNISTTALWNAKTIQISDSKVTAKSMGSGAGIGGGLGGIAEDITITRSEVTATAAGGGAGIGGGNGGASNRPGNAKSIKITDSKVSAQSEGRGAGIGGGVGGSADGITIAGASEVYASSAQGGAGIGGGSVVVSSKSSYVSYGSASNITISGGKVTAIGGQAYTRNGSSFGGGAGIGGGYGGSGTNIVLNIDTGSADVTAVGGTGAAGIGGGADTAGSATAASVRIAKKVKLHAYADGTKMAVQSTRGSDEADSDSNDILNGRFKAGVLTDTSGENLFEVVDASGNTLNTFALPVINGSVYRSFAVDLPDTASASRALVFNTDGKYQNNITGYKTDARTVVYVVPSEQMLNADEIAFPENGFTYQFVSGTAGRALPQSVLSLLPGSQGQSVFTLADLRRLVSPSAALSPVADGSGTWVFAGWSPAGSSVLQGEQLQSGNFVGTWVYLEDDDDERIPLLPLPGTDPVPGTEPLPVGETLPGGAAGTAQAEGTAAEAALPSAAPDDTAAANAAAKLPQTGAPVLAALGLALSGAALGLAGLFGKRRG